MPHFKHRFAAALLWLACTPAALAAELPSWQSLVYEQKSFWITATSIITLAHCDGSELWCLEASNSVADNQETVRVITDDSGRASERQRYSKGSQRRRKRWQFGADAVLRERLEPRGDTWQATSRRELPYPAGAPLVTDAHLLLALATPDISQEFTVLTDLNFYRVTLVPAGEDLVAADPSLGLASPQREVRLTILRAEPLLVLENKQDFGLLGLTGDIVIAWDRESGLPLQLRGEAPRLGNVVVNLKHYAPRDPRS